MRNFTNKKIRPKICAILNEISDQVAQATIHALPRMSWGRAEALSSSRVRIMMIMMIIMEVMMILMIMMMIQKEKKIWDSKWK